MQRSAPLTRNTPLQRKTPMRRTPFVRTPPASDKPPVFSTLKSRRRHVTVAEGGRYLAACRGEPCYLCVDGVCHLDPRDETVVPCHENSLAAGKGMGLKADHERTVPGCMWCHSWLDHGPATREAKRAVFVAAHGRWVLRRARKLKQR